jgi:hypothetical protein
MNYGHQLSAYPLNAFLVFSPPLIITHVSTHPFHQFIHKIYPKIQIFSFRVHTVRPQYIQYIHFRSSTIISIQHLHHSTLLAVELFQIKSSQGIASPRLVTLHCIANPQMSSNPAEPAAVSIWDADAAGVEAWIRSISALIPKGEFRYPVLEVLCLS